MSVQAESLYACKREVAITIVTYNGFSYRIRKFISNDGKGSSDESSIAISL